MAKLYKMEMFILDVNENYSDLEEIVNDIETKSDIYIKPFNVEKAEVEWDDNIDLNMPNCSLENYRRYFKKNS